MAQSFACSNRSGEGVSPPMAGLHFMQRIYSWIMPRHRLTLVEGGWSLVHRLSMRASACCGYRHESSLAIRESEVGFCSLQTSRAVGE